MTGNELLSHVASQTGLPDELMLTELIRLLEAASISKDSCSLDDLRAVLAEYAQDILLAVKEEYSEVS